MPYKSKAQRRKYTVAEDGAGGAVVTWNVDRASRGKKLPERKKPVGKRKKA